MIQLSFFSWLACNKVSLLFASSHATTPSLIVTPHLHHPRSYECIIIVSFHPHHKYYVLYTGITINVMCNTVGFNGPALLLAQRLSRIFAFPPLNTIMLTAALRSSITRGARCAHTAASNIPKPRGGLTLSIRFSCFIDRRCC